MLAKIILTIGSQNALACHKSLQNQTQATSPHSPLPLPCSEYLSFVLGRKEL